MAYNIACRSSLTAIRCDRPDICCSHFRLRCLWRCCTCRGDNRHSCLHQKYRARCYLFRTFQPGKACKTSAQLDLGRCPADKLLRYCICLLPSACISRSRPSLRWHQLFQQGNRYIRRPTRSLLHCCTCLTCSRRSCSLRKCTVHC